MSVFLSQINLDDKDVEDDIDTSLEQEDRQQEKELKEFLDNELEDDDFFDDDSSFSSQRTSQNGQISPRDDENRENLILKHDRINTKPLLTSRGLDLFEHNIQESKIHDPVYAHNNYDQEHLIPSALYDHQIDQRGQTGVARQSENSNNNSYYDYVGMRIEEGEHGSYFDGEVARAEPCSHMPQDYFPDFHKQGGQQKSSNVNENLTNFSESEKVSRDILPTTVPLNTNRYPHTTTSREDGGLAFHKKDFATAKTSRIPRYSLSNVENSLNTSYSSYKDGKEASWIQDEQINLKYHESVLTEGDNMKLYTADPSSEVTQLRILYDARGRKIEELSKKLGTQEDDSQREIRILKHELFLIKGEREGLTVSLEQAQKLNCEYKEEISSLQAENSTQANTALQIQREREELKEKLETAEATIESLSIQIRDLNHADSISRARAHHETILATTRQKHEEEVLHLKEKLDETKSNLAWKTEDLARLHDEILSLQKTHNEFKTSSAEKVNQLTKQLQDSQKQCQELINCGSADSLNDLRMKLKQTEADKEKLNSHIKDLEDVNSELKEKFYALQVDVENTNAPLSSTPFNPTAALAGRTSIRNSLKTPINRVLTLGKIESPSNSMRDELIKSLANNRMKRDEICTLKGELEKMKSQVEEKEQLVATMMDQLGKINGLTIGTDEKPAKTNADEKDVAKFEQLRKELEEKDTLLNEEKSKTDALNNENRQLKSQMAEMVRDFDRETVEKMERQHQMYMDFTDEVKRSAEKELVAEHLEEVSTLKETIEALNEEILQIKRDYLNLAQENRTLEEQVKRQCLEEAELHLKEVKESLEQKFKEEMNGASEKEHDRYLINLEEQRNEWNREKEIEIKQKVDDAVTSITTDWKRQEKVLRAELKDMQVKFSEEQESCERKKETELKAKVEAIKAEWDQSKNRELQDAIEKLKLEHQNDLNLKVQSAVEEAKEKWIEEETEKNRILKEGEVLHTTKERQFSERADSLVREKQCLEEQLNNLKSISNAYQQELEIARKRLNDSTAKYTDDMSKLRSTLLEQESLFNVKEKELKLAYDQQCRDKDKEIETLKEYITGRKAAEASIQMQLETANADLATVSRKLFTLLGDNRRMTINISERDQSSADLTTAIDDLKTIWSKKVMEMKQQVLKEESKKLRAQIEAEVQQQKQDEFDLQLNEERERLKVEEESQAIDELKETIVILKTNFEKRLLEAKQVAAENAVELAREKWMAHEEITREKIKKEALEDAERRIETIKSEMQHKDEAAKRDNELLVEEKVRLLTEEHKKDVEHRMKTAKVEWLKELNILKQEHEKVIQQTKSEARNEMERDKEKLKESSQEFFWSLRNEYQQKMRKQKLELEKYYDGLIQRTLEVSQKEWTSAMEKRLEEAFDRRRNGSRLSPIGKSNCSSSENSQGVISPPTFMTSPAYGTSKINGDVMADNTIKLNTSSSNIFHDDYQQNRCCHTSACKTSFESFLEHFEKEIRKLQESKSKTVCIDRSVQTVPSMSDNEAYLQEMREYYMDTLSKIKFDFTEHVKRTRENATENIRKEVAKERKIVVNKIKKYYLKLLQKGRDGSIADDQLLAFEKLVAKLDFSKDGSSKTKSIQRKHGEDQSLDSFSVSGSLPSGKQTRQCKDDGNAQTEMIPVKLPSENRALSPSTSMFSGTTDRSFYQEFPSSVPKQDKLTRSVLHFATLGEESVDIESERT